MTTFHLILLLLMAVLVSAILDQIVPRVSLPLIQIALGIGCAFLSLSPIEINVEPELFMVLFIAPLLFSDAMESNKQHLMENLPTILSLAIGLVLLITLSVGFVLHLIVPSIPLAAAFALGAALGEKVANVKVGAGMGDTPATIAAEGPMSLEMERIMAQSPEGAMAPKAQRVLEINAEHPVFEKLAAAKASDDGEKLALYANVLLDQALLVAGLPVEDPVQFAENVCKLM